MIFASLQTHKSGESQAVSQGYQKHAQAKTVLYNYTIPVNDDNNQSGQGHLFTSSNDSPQSEEIISNNTNGWIISSVFLNLTLNKSMNMIAT